MLLNCLCKALISAPPPLLLWYSSRDVKKINSNIVSRNEEQTFILNVYDIYLLILVRLGIKKDTVDWLSHFS